MIKEMISSLRRSGTFCPVASEFLGNVLFTLGVRKSNFFQLKLTYLFLAKYAHESSISRKNKTFIAYKSYLFSNFYCEVPTDKVIGTIHIVRCRNFHSIFTKKNDF